MKSIDDIENWDELADELLNVVTELHCREISSNTIMYRDVSYIELCNRAIKILEILRT
jgi:hypothetical protein